MAMKREYLSVDGEIFGEVTNGVVNFYDRDALGSVVAIEDGAGNTVSTIEYKPFGDVRTYTGENPLSSPRRFLWCGTHGYRFNERYAQYTSHYVRARHYSSLQGMWSTVDPLYPSERAYGYVGNRVTVGIDPSGLRPVSSIGSSSVGADPAPAGRIECTPDWNNYVYKYCNHCYAGKFWPKSGQCAKTCDFLARSYYYACNKHPNPCPGIFKPYSPDGRVAPWPPCGVKYEPPEQKKPYYSSRAQNEWCNYEYTTKDCIDLVASEINKLLVEPQFVTAVLVRICNECCRDKATDKETCYSTCEGVAGKLGMRLIESFGGPR